MKRHIKWLIAEIDGWVNAGIIAPDQGEAIKKRYPESEQGRAWGRIIFFSIGAILFGLGVILLFAYNWQRIPKFIKLAVIFAALIGAHGAGFWLRRPQSAHQATGEGLHLLGTMIFGAGIWLIAQIYHIEEHYPTAFLIWALGALIMAWSLPSIAHGIGAVVLFVLWNCFEAFDFKDPQLLAPYLILGAIGPLAWLRRSRVLSAVVVIGFLITLFPAVSKVEGDLAALVISFCGCLLIAGSIVVRQRDLFPELGPVFNFIGFFIYFGMLLILSFYHRGSGIWSVEFDQFLQSLYFFSFALAAIAAWAWAIWPAPGKKGQPNGALRPEYYCVMATLALMILNTLGLIPLKGWLGVAVFNLLYLYQCVIIIMNGCKTLNLKTTVTGCVLFAVIAMARYTDLFHSLVARSLVFFIAGAALFSVGLYYSRSRKQVERLNP